MADLDAHDGITEEELAALADGSLDRARRAAVEAAVAASPRLQSLLAVQRSVVEAIGAANAQTHATHDLRERLARQPVQAMRRPRRRLGWVGALAGIAAAVALVFVLLPSGAGGPTVAKAAEVAARPANGPAPRAAGDKVLDAGVDGVAFPDYTEKFGWQATGSRRDNVAKRPLTTVVYRKGVATVSYAIVSGEALAVPAGRTVVQEGTPIVVVDGAGRTVVTWQRQGHTCVMVGDGVDEATLIELAGWRGKGSIPF